MWGFWFRRFRQRLPWLVAGAFLGLWTWRALRPVAPQFSLHLPAAPVRVQAPPMPTTLQFAGEDVPLHDPQVRHDLAEQLIYNAFTPSFTLGCILRARRWRAVMLPILRSYGIPPDFFYLMVAESGARNLRSYAGAHGYWQFMPQTAKEFGLLVNDDLDERLDPTRSTHAACAYLKAAYQRYGNWALVAASYNMGMGGVDWALNQQQQKSYWALLLNPETAQYLFRILALKLILDAPETYGFQVKEADYWNFEPTDTLWVQHSIPDLVSWSRQHGATYKQVRRLNPWMLGKSLPAPQRGGYSVLLPKH